MTAQHQTQCPKCQTRFAVPEQYLKNPKAQARCGRCQTKFLVNQYLVKNHTEQQSIKKTQPNPSSVGSKVAQNQTAKTVNSQAAQQKPAQAAVAKPQPTTQPTAKTTSAQTAQKLPSATSARPQNTANTAAVPQKRANTTQNPPSPTKPTATAGQQPKETTINPTVNHLNGHRPNQPSINKNQTIKDESDDFLIHDDLEDGSEETNLSDELSHMSVDDLSHLFNQEVHQVHEKEKQHKINPDEDNSWIEALIEEEKQEPPTSTIEPQPTADYDLSDLLSEYDVDTVEAIAPSQQDYIEKVNSRLPKKPTSQQMATKQSPIAMFFWVIGCLVLLLLLIAQYVAFNLDSVIKKPQYAQYLHSICDIASCSLPNAEIEAFDVNHIQHKTNKEQGDFNTNITAHLDNQSRKSQLYPNLKVSIYQDDKLIGQFVATPDDYLSVTQRLLEPNQTARFMFSANMNNKDITNIEIEPFY